MDGDEREFEKKLRKFSVAKQCPKCGNLTLTFANNRVYCGDCGYEEAVPSVR